jgi:hypothetical protein
MEIYYEGVKECSIRDESFVFTVEIVLHKIFNILETVVYNPHNPKESARIHIDALVVDTLLSRDQIKSSLQKLTNAPSTKRRRSLAFTKNLALIDARNDLLLKHLHLTRNRDKVLVNFQPSLEGVVPEDQLPEGLHPLVIGTIQQMAIENEKIKRIFLQKQWMTAIRRVLFKIKKAKVKRWLYDFERSRMIADPTANPDSPQQSSSVSYSIGQSHPTISLVDAEFRDFPFLQYYDDVIDAPESLNEKSSPLTTALSPLDSVDHSNANPPLVLQLQHLTISRPTTRAASPDLSVTSTQMSPCSKGALSRCAACNTPQSVREAKGTFPSTSSLRFVRPYTSVESQHLSPAQIRNLPPTVSKSFLPSLESLTMATAELSKGSPTARRIKQTSDKLGPSSPPLMGSGLSISSPKSPSPLSSVETPSPSRGKTPKLPPIVVAPPEPYF